jgi:HPt (histidine-containing phosphotransfer) domain-containing protein
MTDYLAKPITGTELTQMLMRHLSAARLGAPPARACETTTLQVFDASVLGSLPMVADGSRPEYAGEVLEQFRQHSIDTLQLYERAAEAGDEETRLRCMHNLKSSSAQVGLGALAAVAAELEACLRDGAAPDAGSMLRLYTAHSRALEAITEHAA